MTITQLYKTYKIMPALQTHMLRVSGVAYRILKEHTVKDDFSNIIVACLLHDMGNIIKFDLSLFPAFIEPNGLAYWENIKQEYIKTYGTDEHQATMMISKKILNNIKSIIFSDNLFLPLDTGRTLELIDSIGFSNAKLNCESNDLGKQICTYSDMRVKPSGVVSLSDRLHDGRKRFNLRKPSEANELFFEKMSLYMMKIESELFESIPASPEEITDENVTQTIQQFLSKARFRSQ